MISFPSILLRPLFLALVAIAGVTATPTLAAPEKTKQAPTKKVAAKATALPLRPSDYQLGAGDVLSVLVLNQPELSAETIKVDGGGKVRLPMVGTINVSGQTISQVARQIRVRLSRELNQPDVTIRLLEARPQRIFVSGAVVRPGVLDLSANWRVSEVISASGGLSTRPELVSATLSRGNRPAISLNLASILRDSSSPSNLRVQNGDVLRIAETSFPIRIAGQVKLPGAYDMPVGSTVADALALGGGFGPRAASRKVTLTRVKGTVVPLNLDPQSPSPNTNIKLQAGDLILVPESTDRVALLGAVAKPGYFDIDAGTTLRVSQALVLAGGVTPKAALTRATLVRANGTQIPLDMFGLLVLGDQTRNVAIEPGDIITIPEGMGVTVFGAVNTQGTYAVEEGRAPRLLDVVTLAGGLSARPEDVTYQITRRLPAVGETPESAPVNAVGAAPGPPPTRSSSPMRTVVFKIDASQITSAEALATRVFDGDLITVTALQTRTIAVSGEVKTPGTLEVKEGTTLVEAINRAGGPTDKAALTKVVITSRDQKRREVDVRAAIKDGATIEPIVLQAGDYVVVPENTQRVYVMQAVNQPGYFTIPEKGGLTVGEAINKAGGPRERAKIWEVGILRETAKGPTTQILNIQDPKVALAALNTPLQHGDVLVVPEGRQKTSAWQTAMAGVSALRLFSIF